MPKNVGINIEADICKDHVEAVAKAISTIFNDGKKNGVDQATIVEALNVLSKAAYIQGINITGCNLSNSQTEND